MAPPERGIDEAELRELLLARAPKLLDSLRRKIPGRCRRTVSPDDVLQEIWLAAFQGIGSFRPDGRPHAFDRWLSVISNNELSDALKPLRRMKRNVWRQLSNHARSFESTLDDLVAILASSCRTPSRDSSMREAQEAVRTAVDNLPDEQKRALTLQYYKGRSMAEIAGELGTSERAAAGLVYRARQGVADQLGQEKDFFSDVPSTNDAG